VISPSRWLMGYYQARGFFYESKKIILPNPIIFKKVDKHPDDEAASQIIKLIFVGQLERFKGILFLIEALKKISSPNWQLLIVGSGGAETEVKQAVDGDQRFQLIGRVEQNKLADYYRQADLTVVPSLCYENSPKVIDESLVANVPVIASDIGGVSEIVKDDYNGFTFAPGNQENLIEVLEYFFNHPEKIAELKKNCFVSVRNFSVGNYLKKIISLIQ
jgi:glycosyltransferase involved in cell wall biosynthesis